MEKGEKGNGLTSVGVDPVVIEMLKKLQGYYQYKNGEKMSYGKIVEKLVLAEISSLGLELNGNNEEKREVEVVS